MRKGLIIIGVLILICQPVRSADVTAPDFDFVLEIAGYVLQRQIGTVEHVSVTKPSPLGGSTDVVVDAVYAEARRCPGPYLRLMAFTRVTEKDHPRRTAQVTMLIDARLDVVRGQKGAVTLRIVALPATLSAAAEFPSEDWARDLVLCMAQELGRKFSVDIPLEGLDVIASVRSPSSPPVQVLAYELGFGWVLQISGPLQISSTSAPRIFLIGDSFSMSLGAGLIQRLADQQFSAGTVPHALNERGMPQADGPIHVDRMVISLQPDVISVGRQGRSADGKPALVTWEMAFIETPDGLVLDIRRVTVNGKDVPVQKSAEMVNPMDELIKNIAFGPTGGALFASPLGRVKITAGRISPSGIFIAGRA